MKDTENSDTSCIDYTSNDPNPKHSNVPGETTGTVLPMYKKCSGIGDCENTGGCKCSIGVSSKKNNDVYDLDTLGFGVKQKLLYNCQPKSGNDPMKDYIQILDTTEGTKVKDNDNSLPFSYLECPESKDGARCSEQTCSNYKGYSWFNFPSRYGATPVDDKYLPPSLCGGRGVCDSAEENGKGICLCDKNGFIGSTCQICIYNINSLLLFYFILISGLSSEIL